MTTAATANLELEVVADADDEFKQQNQSPVRSQSYSISTFSSNPGSKLRRFIAENPKLRVALTTFDLLAFGALTLPWSITELNNSYFFPGTTFYLFADILLLFGCATVLAAVMQNNTQWMSRSGFSFIGSIIMWCFVLGYFTDEFCVFEVGPLLSVCQTGQILWYLGIIGAVFYVDVVVLYFSNNSNFVRKWITAKVRLGLLTLIAVCFLVAWFMFVGYLGQEQELLLVFNYLQLGLFVWTMVAVLFSKMGPTLPFSTVWIHLYAFVWVSLTVCCFVTAMMGYVPIRINTEDIFSQLGNIVILVSVDAWILIELLTEGNDYQVIEDNLNIRDGNNSSNGRNNNNQVN